MMLREIAPMTEAGRQDWLRFFAADLASAFQHKYLKGQREHDGDLGHVTTGLLLDEIFQEQLDQIAYLAELRRRLLTDGSLRFVPHDMLVELYSLAWSVKGHRDLTKQEQSTLDRVAAIVKGQNGTEQSNATQSA